MQLKAFLHSFLYAVIFCFASFSVQAEDHKLLGEIFPVFEVQNLNGESKNSLSKELDKPVLFNVWATWCTPCIKELPVLDSLAIKGDFDVVALSTDIKMNAVYKFFERHQLNNIKVLFDKFGRKSRSLLKTPSLPVTFLVNKKGVVKDVFLGDKEWLDDDFYANLLKKSSN